MCVREGERDRVAGWRRRERGRERRRKRLVFEVCPEDCAVVIVPRVLDTNITKSVATSMRAGMKYCYTLEVPSK